jgi:tRNA pseudouridine38-40 synthase
MALNGLLPSDIRVREISPASAEFHARFSVKSKIYHYKIYSDTIMDPFQRRFAYHNMYKLNTAAMREAAKYFIGKHDFTSFENASHNDRVPDPVKHIFRFDLKEMVEFFPTTVSIISILHKIYHVCSIFLVYFL